MKRWQFSSRYSRERLGSNGQTRLLWTLSIIVLRGRTYANPASYAQWQARSLLEMAIAQISQEAALPSDLAPNPHLGPAAVRLVQRARELLESSHAKPVAVSHVATQVGWSADHLGKMCREILVVSPARVQMQARLRRAEHMLAECRSVSPVSRLKVRAKCEVSPKPQLAAISAQVKMAVRPFGYRRPPRRLVGRWLVP